MNVYLWINGLPQIQVIKKLLNPQSRNDILLNSNKANCLFHSISWVDRIFGQCLTKFPVLSQFVFKNEKGFSCLYLGGVADKTTSSQYGTLCFSTEHFTCQVAGFKWVASLSRCYILLRAIVLVIKLRFECCLWMFHIIVSTRAKGVTRFLLSSYHYKHKSSTIDFAS